MWTSSLFFSHHLRNANCATQCYNISQSNSKDFASFVHLCVAIATEERRWSKGEIIWFGVLALNWEFGRGRTFTLDIHITKKWGMNCTRGKPSLHFTENKRATELGLENLSEQLTTYRWVLCCVNLSVKWWMISCKSNEVLRYFMYFLKYSTWSLDTRGEDFDAMVWSSCTNMWERKSRQF